LVDTVALLQYGSETKPVFVYGVPHFVTHLHVDRTDPFDKINVKTCVAFGTMFIAKLDANLRRGRSLIKNA